MKKQAVIIGGGAAGIFTAALIAELDPSINVVVLEKTRQLLTKVRISGGGRCNVTHAAFDPKKLILNYPRGHKELLGPFHKFQPRDTIEWFEQHGVELKTEEDGRLFPVTDSSATIANCLLDAARTAGVQILTEHSVQAITHIQGQFHIQIDRQETLIADFLVLATGGSPQGHALAKALGHSIVAPVPSLFTFNISNFSLADLSGITVQDAQISLPELGYQERGSLLITHFGLSGPCALKTSSFGARALHSCNYHTPLLVNWLPSLSSEEIFERVKANKPLLPLNLWKTFLRQAGISPTTSWNHIPHTQLQTLVTLLTASPYTIQGKTTHKAEFVTCGGVSLSEIDFRTMQSKQIPSLFFTGEILDIDGVTGGFNFQNAWTTAYLAAQGLRKMAHST
jgi:hypothetical protein